MSVNEEQNLGNEDEDLVTGQCRNLVGDPFFESVEKLPARGYLVAQIEKWKRRALAFQEGYKEKAFEVIALEIQLMDLRAHGVDKVTARINESLKTKMLAACIERNEARDALRGLLRGHKCWCSTWAGGEHEPECVAAAAALVNESAKRPVSALGNDGPASKQN